MSEKIIVSVQSADIFQSSSLVLSSVTLDIEQGEFVFLIGKTGSGKSSLLKLLYGDLELKQGTASVAGFSLNHLRTKQIPFLRRKLGIVFQDFQLLSDRSVSDNLMFVLRATGWKDKAKMKARIDEILDMVGLSTKGFKMPHELSGGEQQRVVIGRALLNDPELILADEPTGNLDPETSDGIMKLLLDISRSSRAVLMATHNYSLIEKYPARIIKCENGKLIDSKALYENVS
ncbi:MAG: ATP-binding cassette domain-containing protein [Bacteroidia bacterium]|nr:ATP-binding cassette domain-containing protein [Bacteroidia bacterium]